MRFILALSMSALLYASALADTAATPTPAQAVLTAVPQSIDFTNLLVAIATSVIAVVGAIATALVNARIKDKQAAATIDTALMNGLGAMQTAAQAGIQTARPVLSTTAISPQTAVGVQYVLDHAGDELKRFNITPDKVAQKLEARLGLLNIQANLATAASSAPTPAPLAPVTSAATKPA